MKEKGHDKEDKRSRKNKEKKTKTKTTKQNKKQNQKKSTKQTNKQKDAGGRQQRRQKIEKRWRIKRGPWYLYKLTPIQTPSQMLCSSSDTRHLPVPLRQRRVDRSSSYRAIHLHHINRLPSTCWLFDHLNLRHTIFFKINAFPLPCLGHCRCVCCISACLYGC